MPYFASTRSRVSPCRIGLTFALGLALAGSSACLTSEFRSADGLNSACINSAGDLFAVLVQFDECLSSSCDTVETATCELVVEGNIVTITGEAMIKSTMKSGPNGGCTSDCGFVTTDCSLELPPGDYILRGAGDDLPFTHPLAMETGACGF